ncbi:hypothetical protein CB0940_01148 [Cercospora beticola]|uniref:Adhesin domain-containing protein n=1 Tax=Cercospora beticola TaxID=122368 RepID=A0A2G5ICI0_CERBT|nr:hypothetical protein CB0940_01148 [Cercospora beticola]PIB02485.1 hypothetical protein CB0940_01148 [Cercospora beticola]WPA96577.1 hypothetical protein RHO25_001184 [Cercospora beticola]CAK1355084.1 unnamed protein product [Cercospora beticola]
MAMSHYDRESEQYLTDPETEDESDVDSLISAGPADDYFQQRFNRQDRAIEDSSSSPGAESKAREAAEHRTSSAPAAQPRPVEWTMSGPEAHTEAPPPTYESISNDRAMPMSQQHEVSGRAVHYGSAFTPAAIHSISTREQGGALPQSMRDNATSEPDEETGLLGWSKNKRTRSRISCCRSLSVCNAVLGLAVVMFILAIFGAMIDDSTSDEPQDDGGDYDGSPARPPTAPWVPGASSCSPNAADAAFSLDFEQLQNFTFLELMENSAYFNGQIKGHIQVRPAKTSQSPDLRVSISYSTSPQWQVQSSNYVKTADSLSLQLPSLETSSISRSSPCIGVYVNIDVRPGITLDNWELVTGNLNIEVDDGLFNRSPDLETSADLQMTGSSSFNAIHGNVNIGYWSSRRTEVETISGSIRGKYALRDLLHLKSQSGSIDVNVDPKREDSKHPASAEFLVHTSSGSVKVNTPTSGNIPIRNYQTRIETSSGSITGDFILGMLNSFHTQSGTVRATLLPVYDSTEISFLHTDTKSASQTLTILPPYSFPGDSFAQLRSDHKFFSTSGTLHLQYPDEWEGDIYGDTTSGSVRIRGKDVEFSSALDGAGSWPWGKHIQARKGNGKGRLKFTTVSGSVDLRMGEL